MVRSIDLDLPEDLIAVMGFQSLLFALFFLFPTFSFDFIVFYLIISLFLLYYSSVMLLIKEKLAFKMKMLIVFGLGAISGIIVYIMNKNLYQIVFEILFLFAGGLTLLFGWHAIFRTTNAVKDFEVRKDKKEISLEIFKFARNFRNRETLAIISILVIGSALRLYQIEQKSLWLDELYTYWVSSRPILDVIKISQTDVHPPFYYLVINIFFIFSESEFMMRFPSMIFGVASIYVTYKLGKYLFGPLEGLIAGFLISISTFHIHYSQEARMYSLLCFLSILSMYLFIKGIRTNDRKYWIGFSIVTTLNLYTHYYAIIPLFILLFYLFIKLLYNHIVIKNLTEKINIKNIGESLLHITILFIIWTPFLLRKITEKTQSASYSGTFLEFINLLFSRMIPGNIVEGIIEIPFYYLYIFFSLIGIAIIYKKNGKDTVLLIMWIIISIISSYIFSQQSKQLFDPNLTERYFIFIIPIIFILTGRGIVVLSKTASNIKISHIYENILESYATLVNMKIEKDINVNFSHNNKSKSLSISILIFVVILLLVSYSTPALFTYYSGKKEDYRAIGKYLNENIGEGDIILMQSDWKWSMLYYFHKNNSIIKPANISEIEKIVAEAHQNWNRVWFIYMLWHWSDLDKKTLEDYFASRFNIESKEFGFIIFASDPYQAHIPIIEDSYIQKWSTVSYGNYTKLLIKKEYRITFLKANISGSLPKNSEITKATLYVYCEHVNKSYPEITMHEISDAWSQNVTWETSPGLGPGIDSVKAVSGGYLSLEGTDWVKRNYDNGDYVISIALVKNDEFTDDSIDLTSMEGEHKPYWIIKFAT